MYIKSDLKQYFLNLQQMGKRAFCWQQKVCPQGVVGERGGSVVECLTPEREVGGFEAYRCRVVSLSKTLYSPKVLVNYPGSGGSVPTWLKKLLTGTLSLNTTNHPQLCHDLPKLTYENTETDFEEHRRAQQGWAGTYFVPTYIHT